MYRMEYIFECCILYELYEIVIANKFLNKICNVFYSDKDLHIKLANPGGLRSAISLSLIYLYFL